MNWKNDEELFALLRTELYSAVLGDILDEMHYYHQFLPQRIQPLTPDMVLAGRAMPVLEMDVSAEVPCAVPAKADKTFGLMLEALDALRKDEVYLCSGASSTYALIGELMCTRMQVLGAAGTAVNGFHRDTTGILKLGLPCFSYGCYAQDQAPRGKVIDFRVPIDIEGVHVEPGDIVFGDRDGVLIIPRKIEAEVIQRAYEKANGERVVEKAIRGGMSAVESFAKHGIM